MNNPKKEGPMLFIEVGANGVRGMALEGLVSDDLFHLLPIIRAELTRLDARLRQEKARRHQPA